MMEIIFPHYTADTFSYPSLTEKGGREWCNPTYENHHQSNYNGV